MSDEAIALLRSIDASLRDLLALSRTKLAARQQPPAVPVASNADLDGQYGDPAVVAKDPKDWSGPTMKGRRFSECPPEYLDLVAARLDYFAEQNASGTDDDKRKAAYNRKDAARARGWAARLRAGWKPDTSTNGMPPADSIEW